MGNEITQQHLSQLQTQLPLISTAEFLCTTRRMQLKRHTVTKTWRHGGKPQIKLSAGEITIVNIKIIIKPVNEATRWVIMTSIMIVGRCLFITQLPARDWGNWLHLDRTPLKLRSKAYEEIDHEEMKNSKETINKKKIHVQPMYGAHRAELWCQRPLLQCTLSNCRLGSRLVYVIK